MLFRFILYIFFAPFQFIAIYICRLRNYYYYPHLLPGSYSLLLLFCCCFLMFFDAHFMEQQQKTSKDFWIHICCCCPCFVFIPKSIFTLYVWLILFLYFARLQQQTNIKKLFKCNLLISIFRS